MHISNSNNKRNMQTSGIAKEITDTSGLALQLQMSTSLGKIIPQTLSTPWIRTMRTGSVKLSTYKCYTHYMFVASWFLKIIFPRRKVLGIMAEQSVNEAKEKQCYSQGIVKTSCFTSGLNSRIEDACCTAKCYEPRKQYKICSYWSQYSNYFGDVMLKKGMTSLRVYNLFVVFSSFAC